MPTGSVSAMQFLRRAMWHVYTREGYSDAVKVLDNAASEINRQYLAANFQTAY